MRAVLAVLLVAAGSLGPLGAGEASAATTIKVNCRANPSALTTALGTASDGDTLEIEGTCTGPFVVDKSLTLDGKGKATLSGGAPVLIVGVGKTVVVNELTITGGNASCTLCNPVGGIENGGTLTLSHSKVSGNSASCSGNCSSVVGGILNEGSGTLTLSDTKVSRNSASCPADCFVIGGIYSNSSGGAPTLSHSTVSGNSASCPRNCDVIGGISKQGGAR